MDLIINKQRFINFFHVSLLVWCYSSMNLFSTYRAATTSAVESDRIALLAFKDQITNDPFEALSSWNDSLHFCTWGGVTCGRRNRRVTMLELPSKSLVGSISPFIGNLTFLRNVDLRNNSFNGEIPQDIGRLFRLQRLNLSENLLQGQIPINLTYCTELRFFYAMWNQLVGRIPTELGSLSKLIGLGLTNNHLIGLIPPSLSNISSLVQLSLMDNQLIGNIPMELGKLSRLEFFQIAANSLSGTIPAQLFNISSIYYISVTQNQFHGTIPPFIGLTLPNLRYLELGQNRFSGSLPNSISNASKLFRLDFSSNQFTGRIPANLGNLRYLIRLNFGRNQLGTGEADDDLSFLSSLTNCSYLEVLAFNENNLTGRLPDSIANLSARLTYLYMGANKISGKIPTEIGNLVSLASFGMEENRLTGNIPISMGVLPNIQFISMFGNQISGQIPPNICNNTQLEEINFDRNRLQGRLPPSLGNCHKLKILSFSQNHLVGTIPKQVIGLSTLSDFLDLSQNFLTGNLPSDVGSLKNIHKLYLSDNELSGEIPSSLGNCVSLDGLYLGGNNFHGNIPQSLKSLKGIQDLDVSRNNLSGPIPGYLKSFLFLKNLNLSSNDFEGEVPKEGVFMNSTAFSILGNNKLCGGITQLHLPSCPNPRSKQPRKQFLFKRMLLIIGPVTCSILLGFFVIFFWRKKARNKPSSSTSPLEEDMFRKVSYAELLKATDGFLSHNLVGVGSYGSVYKGRLGQETTTVVAVKVLDLQRRGASKSFMAECEALRCIRHRNLVKVLTSCSSMDYKGNEFKALVYEFMSNGSLDSWLHPTANGQLQMRRPMSFIGRLNVAIDVASALDYLHHHCHTPIVHCDLKPSNVLLDDDMNGHVGDFGLAKVLSEILINGASENHTSSSGGIKGSVGYVAPEYGMSGDVLTSGDVYSYGVMLLEMFTGRRPTDDMFKDGLSLHSFAKMVLPDRVMQIIDPTVLTLLQDGDSDDDVSNKGEMQVRMFENLVEIVKIGVICSTESPKERLEMVRVVKELQSIRDKYVVLGITTI